MNARRCAMPLATATGGRSRHGGKSGQRPYFRSSQSTAAQRASRRRARGKRGAWLNAMPRGASQGHNGNGGKAPAYSDKPFNGFSWKKGKG